MICRLSQTATLLRLLPADASLPSRVSVATMLENLPHISQRRVPVPVLDDDGKWTVVFVDMVLRLARAVRAGTATAERLRAMAEALEDEAAVGAMAAYYEPLRRARG